MSREVKINGAKRDFFFWSNNFSYEIYTFFFFNRFELAFACAERENCPNSDEEAAKAQLSHTLLDILIEPRSSLESADEVKRCAITRALKEFANEWKRRIVWISAVRAALIRTLHVRIYEGSKVLTSDVEEKLV